MTNCRARQAQTDTTAETGRAGGRPVRVQGLGAHTGDVQSAEGTSEEGEGSQAGSEKSETHVASAGSLGARNHLGHIHHDQVLIPTIISSKYLNSFYVKRQRVNKRRRRRINIIYDRFLYICMLKLEYVFDDV